MTTAPNFIITAVDADSADAQQLLQDLSDTLLGINGDSGRSSFDANETRGGRGGFFIARNSDGELLGCAALRPLGGDNNSSIGELKRMYARPGQAGVGAALVAHVENMARQYAYAEVWLATRLANGRAVAFYRKHGYADIPAYGKYVGAEQSICLGKTL